MIVAYFQMKTSPLMFKKVWYNKKGKFDWKILVNIPEVILRVLKTAKLMITDFHTMYYLFYGFSAFLGLKVSEFFFAAQLVEITQKYTVLQKVILSFTEPIDIILLTLMSFFVLNYMFTLVAYW